MRESTPRFGERCSNRLASCGTLAAGLVPAQVIDLAHAQNTRPSPWQAAWERFRGVPMLCRAPLPLVIPGR